MNLSNYFGKNTKLSPIIASVLGAVGTGYLAYLGFSSVLSDKKQTIPASALGKRGVGFENAIYEEVENLTASQRSNISTGTYFGILASEMNEPGGGQAEVEAYDEHLGVRGYIDILLKNNVPVEVKTISSTGLDRLSRPLEAHASQLNFYLHSRQAKYGYVLYLDGQDISRHKIFRVGYQPGRLYADVEHARQHMLQNAHRLPDERVEWLAHSYKTSPAYFRGIRHSSGSASSFDSIKPNPEFPGGRLASIIQAARYSDLSSKHVIPTMGLTIRKHETAIGHHSRRCGAKRAASNHCNGSRAYR